MTMSREEIQAVLLDMQALDHLAAVETEFRSAGWLVFRQSASERRPNKVRPSAPNFLALRGDRIAAVWTRTVSPRAKYAPSLERFPPTVEVVMVGPQDLPELRVRLTSDGPLVDD